MNRIFLTICAAFVSIWAYASDNASEILDQAAAKFTEADRKSVV